MIYGIRSKQAIQSYELFMIAVIFLLYLSLDFAFLFGLTERFPVNGIFEEHRN